MLVAPSASPEDLVGRQGLVVGEGGGSAGLVVAKKLAGSGGGLGRPPCLALPAPGTSLT